MESKLPGKLGEGIFSHENPKNFSDPKVGPRPNTIIRLLCYIDKITPTKVGPLDKIFDLPCMLMTEIILMGKRTHEIFWRKFQFFVSVFSRSLHFESEM